MHGAYAGEDDALLHGDDRHSSLAPRTGVPHCVMAICSKPMEGTVRTAISFITVLAAAVAMMPLLVQPTPFSLLIASL
jgi:hypothetical protein